MQALLDLQIDEGLNEGAINNIWASAKRVSGAQKESLSSVAGGYSELFSQLKTDSLLEADGIGEGSASLAEFGALAQVSKDFGGSWAQRSRLWGYFFPVPLRNSLLFHSSVC